MNDRYLTVREIAELLKISYDSALEVVKYSGVEYVQVGRQYRVLESTLYKFLNPKQARKNSNPQRNTFQFIERT